MTETRQDSRTEILKALRAELDHQGLDAFLLPRFDAHQGEYVAPHDQRLAYATGFTGSAGMAIVTAREVAVFVDGRYSVQVARECPAALFQHHHLFDAPPEAWLRRYARPGWRVGFDAMHYPPSWYDRLAEACTLNGAEMVPVAVNPVDRIWHDQPAPPLGQVTPFPLQFAGQSVAEKSQELRDWMQQAGVALHVETQPDNIAWFLNVRGDDVAYNPMPQSYLLVGADGTLDWCVAAEKLGPDLADHLPASLRIHPPACFLDRLRQLGTAGQTVSLDPDFSPVAVRLCLQEIGAEILARRSFLTLRKAEKNPTEIEGLRACHLQDGVAWSRFSAWIASEVPQRAATGHPLLEREAEDQMRRFRADLPGYLSDSFKTISAAAGNASLCHYSTSEEQNAPILPSAPYLLDSGGQFDTGTTDATRCFTFGTPRPEGYDRAYTAVFKGFHALATARFPKGTQGHHIDAICRRPLWDLGLDYDHGTGHGIGHRLSVHEQPQKIAKPYNPVDLKPGMVLSIEPGVYLAEQFGIRIENLFVIRAAEDGFMAFENLTFAPIQTEMLLIDQLSREEIDWLNCYHAEVLHHLAPQLGDSERDWLARACAPIG